MKKLPLMLLTVAASACITLNFTACDSITDTSTGSSGSSQINSTTADSSSLVSDKLSSLEEWEAVFDGSNYNNFTASVATTYSSVSSSTVTYTENTPDDNSSTSSYTGSYQSESADSESYESYEDEPKDYDTEDSDPNSTYPEEETPDSSGSDIELTKVTKASDSSTTESTYSSVTRTISGIAEHNFTKDTYLTGTYGSQIKLQQTESDGDTTSSYTQKIYNYTLLTEESERAVSKTDQDDTAGNWKIRKFLSVGLPYTTNCLTGNVVADMDYVSFDNDKLVIYPVDTYAPVYGLLVSSYTDAYADFYGESCTAAVYTDGAYYCRIDYDYYNPSELQMMIIDTADSCEYEQYCDCYIKVNDGHVSYIKLEYTYILNYEATRTNSTEISNNKITQTTEYSFYNFGSTTVTVPDEVTALFE